jgi:hypothetical protein
MPSLIGYRKFIVALLFWLSSTALCLLGLIDGGDFVAVTGLVVGLYGAANAASNYAGGPSGG